MYSCVLLCTTNTEILYNNIYVGRDLKSLTDRCMSQNNI